MLVFWGLFFVGYLDMPGILNVDIHQNGKIFRLQLPLFKKTVLNTSIAKRSIVMDSTDYSSPFLRSVSDAIRVRHYSRKTEKA